MGWSVIFRHMEQRFELGTLQMMCVAARWLLRRKADSFRRTSKKLRCADDFLALDLYPVA